MHPTKPAMPADVPSDAKLAEQLRSHISKLPYEAFTVCAIRVLTHKGYSDLWIPARHSFKGPNAIGGVDLFGKEVTPLGNVPIIVQLKRYDKSRNVSRAAVDQLRGVMFRHGISRAVLLTTTTFSDEAKRAALQYPGRPIFLIDGKLLGELMIEGGIGVLTTRDLVSGETVAEFDEMSFQFLVDYYSSKQRKEGA